MSACVDTSAFYAYLVPADRHHLAVRKELEQRVKRGQTLFSSAFVLCETLGLLQTRHGLGAARTFLTGVFPLVEWRWIDETLFAKIRDVLESRSSRAFTIVDASCVVCVRERAGSDCIAVDDDLRGFGFEVYPA
jgi:predicted nucleic acid-binding protein